MYWRSHIATGLTPCHLKTWNPTRRQITKMATDAPSMFSSPVLCVALRLVDRGQYKSRLPERKQASVATAGVDACAVPSRFDDGSESGGPRFSCVRAGRGREGCKNAAPIARPQRSPPDPASRRCASEELARSRSLACLIVQRYVQCAHRLNASTWSKVWGQWSIIVIVKSCHPVGWQLRVGEATFQARSASRVV